MKHQNLESIRNVKRKSHMKFAFSNSSKVLPKQHANAQFLRLVEQKKNYQSLIKDEINKLQLINANVSDPQVEPFCPNNENLNSDQKINQYYKLELKNGTSLLLNAKIQKSIKSVRQNKQIERYLEEKINTACLSILDKTRKNKTIKSFFQSLKLSHGMRNKQKAARFFEYSKLTRKSFQALFRFTNEIFCMNESVKQKELIFKIFIKRRSLKKFIETIKIQSLIKQSKKYAEKKQIRTKKLYYNYFKQQMNSKKCLIEKICILQKQRKEKNFIQLIEIWKCKILMENKRESLMRKRQKDHFNDLIMKLKQNQQEGKDKFQNFLAEYEQIYPKSQIQYSQHQIQDFAKNQHICSKIKQKMKTQIKLKLLSRRVNASEKFRRGKHFLNLLESHKNILLVKNLQSLNHRLLAYKKLFIFQFVSATEHKRKISKISNIFLLRYLRNFRENISTDIKYKKSLASVTGSKRWLIRNKHIFKSQPFKQSLESTCKFRTDLGSEANIQFWNPISSRSQIDLMQESKFKKLKQMRQKKLFIKILKQRMVRKKKQQTLQYGYKQVRDRRTIKKVWENLKDKQKMGQVMREIDEEAAHQQNEEQNKLYEQVNKILKINNKRKLFEQLSSDYKYFYNKRKLELSRYEKVKLIFLLKLRKIKETRETNDQKMQKLGKISKKRYQFDWKKLARLLRQNLLLKTIQKQKFLMIIEKQLQFERESLYQNNKCEKQCEKKSKKKQEVQNYLEKGIGLIRKVDKNYFIRLLKANDKIAKGSIKVTSIYVSNIFSQMITNKSRLKEIKQIKTKQKQLERLMRIKSLKQILNQMKINHKNSVTRRLATSLTLKRKRDKIIEVLKILFLQSNKSKLRKQKMGKMFKITANHWTIRKRQLFIKLKSILSKRKQIQMNQHQLNTDIKIQEKNIKQNGFQKYLNKQMNQLEQNSSYCQQSQNQFQLSNHLNLEESLTKKQFAQQHSEEQIPYQKYRESIEIEKIETQNQSGQQYQMTAPHKYGEPLQQKQDKFNSFEQNKQISNQESDLANQYDYKYLENRNDLNVLKRYFKEWKFMAKQKQQKQSEKRCQLARKAFNGLRMYAKQKSLVKRYLMQYEQQLHYYPHTAEEYQLFRTVVQNS